LRRARSHRGCLLHSVHPIDRKYSARWAKRTACVIDGPKKRPLDYLEHFHWAVESENSLIGDATKTEKLNGNNLPQCRARLLAEYNLVTHQFEDGYCLEVGALSKDPVPRLWSGATKL
jgi:hypothetical protein